MDLSCLRLSALLGFCVTHRERFHAYGYG